MGWMVIIWTVELYVYIDYFEMIVRFLVCVSVLQFGASVWEGLKLRDNFVVRFWWFAGGVFDCFFF